MAGRNQSKIGRHAENACRQKNGKSGRKKGQRLEKPAKSCRHLPTDFVPKYHPYMLQAQQSEQRQNH
jgi:hypothetical protein